MAGAAKVTVWRGSKNLEPQPDSPQFADGPNGPEYTYNYKGPWGIIVSNIPKRLQTFESLPTDFKIDTVHAVKAAGNVGTLTLTISLMPRNEDTDPTLELEWSTLSKALETHPRYAADGAFPLTDEDLANIEVWKRESSPQLRKAYKFSNPDGGGVVTLSDNAQDLAKKLLRGQDSYEVSFPVCRATSTSTDKNKPKSTKCSVIQDPPKDIKVDGYQYLKTADRVTRRSRKWERVQEWTGVEKIDTDIYSAG